MLYYKLTYSDESEEVKGFESENEAAWFIHNEGDHIVYVEPVAGSVGQTPAS
jgi:hypothetical protein